MKMIAVLQLHNDYTDKRKQYENRFYSDEDDYTGLSLVSVESVIKCFMGEQEACHIE